MGSRRTIVAVVAAGLAACGQGLDDWEKTWQEMVTLRDLRQVTEARGLQRASDGRTLDDLRARQEALRADLVARSPRLRDEQDRRAWTVMREKLSVPGGRQESDDLRRRTYEAFGRAAEKIVVEGETLDRVTILSRLGLEPDRSKRQRLFHALSPVWRAVDGDGRQSPYRALAARETDRWRPGHSPVERAAQELDFEPRDLEATLVRVLERWRDTLAVPGEPWDYWYAGGEAARVLDARLPRDGLLAINDAFYREIGADPVALDIAYDLEPRAGKRPTAFAIFTRRWPSPRAGVFATYREGGLDNLVELLHETGHAAHLSAIRTRPAFLDSPDSDTFTEALGDLLALDAYEPAWQQRHLGQAASAAANLRARHAPVMLDICWALLEWRVHRAPASDPSALWTSLTSQYLKIAPHPEIPWWAIRGQLVSQPGSMMEYALGALLVADLRARQRELRGPRAGPDPTLYPWLGEQLYRFGRERAAREVVRDFLGRPLRAQALMAELATPAR